MVKIIIIHRAEQCFFMNRWNFLSSVGVFGVSQRQMCSWNVHTGEISPTHSQECSRSQLGHPSYAAPVPQDRQQSVLVSFTTKTPCCPGMTVFVQVSLLISVASSFLGTFPYASFHTVVAHLVQCSLNVFIFENDGQLQ